MTNSPGEIIGRYQKPRNAKEMAVLPGHNRLVSGQRARFMILSSHEVIESK